MFLPLIQKAFTKTTSVGYFSMPNFDSTGHTMLLNLNLKNRTLGSVDYLIEMSF